MAFFNLCGLSCSREPRSGQGNRGDYARVVAAKTPDHKDQPRYTSPTQKQVERNDRSLIAMVAGHCHDGGEDVADHEHR